MSDLALIKLFSVAGDVLLALTGMRLAAHCVSGTQKRGVAAFLALAMFWLIPTYWLNSAWWGQCDALYGSLCMLALLLILQDRPALSVVTASLAFAFKLQSIFFLPVYVVFLLARKVRLRHALIFPAVTICVTLPALIAKMPLSRAFGVYFRQAAQYSDYLNLNSSSAFGLLPTDTPRDPAFTIGIVLAALFMLCLWLAAFLRRKRLTDKDILLLFSFVMSLGIPWLLPGMHDRYFFLAEMFAVLVLLRRPRYWPAVLLTFIGSYAGYHAYVFRRYLLFPQWRMGVPSALMGLGLVLSVFFLLRELNIQRK